METSRDSSIWRSLAVAFGDGLAFGVGMKLTQKAGRQAGAPEPEGPVWNDRLGELERRLNRVERAPAAAIGGGTAVPAQFDQKVLEAVVNALEARLKEQAAFVERRLAELEAKIATELKALDRQDHTVVTSMETLLAEVRHQAVEQAAAQRVLVERELTALEQKLVKEHRAEVNGLEDRLVALHKEVAELPRQVADVEGRLDARTSLLHQVEGRVNGLEDRITAFRGELTEELPKAVGAAEGRLEERAQAIQQRSEDQVNALEDRLVALHHELAAGLPAMVEQRVESSVAARTAELEQAIPQQVGTELDNRLAPLQEEFQRELGELTNHTSGLAKAAAASAVEQKLGEVRGQLAAKDREIAELRRELSASDRRAQELLLAIGQTCRDAAERIGHSESPAAAPPEGRPPATGVEANPPAQAQSSTPEPPADLRIAAVAVEAGESERVLQLPAFTHPEPAVRLWKVPLVSSMVLTLGGWMLIHFL